MKTDSPESSHKEWRDITIIPGSQTHPCLSEGGENLMAILLSLFQFKFNIVQPCVAALSARDLPTYIRCTAQTGVERNWQSRRRELER